MYHTVLRATLAMAAGLAALPFSLADEPAAAVTMADDVPPGQPVPGRSYLVLTVDGKVYRGVLTRITATDLDLTLENKRKVSIARKDVEEIRESGKSQ